MPVLVKARKGDTARPRISSDLSDALLLETRDITEGEPAMFANADLLDAGDDAERWLWLVVVSRRLA